MQLSNFYTSSIGRKVIMASTGLFLMAFLVVHLGLNATIFAGDDGALFDRTADFLRHNWGLHLLEVLVFGCFILHIWQGIALTRDNRSKRSTPYAVSPGLSLDPARYMGVLGVIIFAFLLFHLYQFWLPNAIGTRSANLSRLMQATMTRSWVVAIYTLGSIAVAIHLLHGWRSAAISFGVTDRYLRLISAIGISLAIGVPLGLATIPIAMFFKLLQI
ncbi:succinate dehydrogenase cytochrome b subunit [Chamaesiphon sp. VAR_48_metabat_135_sub]|jgi:succinate dehydrogenase / fumarate reductase, cytochrome b subunit|uniref:succinate dehydrogenase cytochrome b subunit n=1 Tax=Chamaesiphon sp. VAR_48_metabat_135_sub TaxID=2964699 RepID=UPI00286D414F|nr:succinate dehydrogenase cytochrome b subunit [Chamaesiphon sp. VAR_48_metabat_135_sub]